MRHTIRKHHRFQILSHISWPADKRFNPLPPFSRESPANVRPSTLETIIIRMKFHGLGHCTSAGIRQRSSTYRLLKLKNKEREGLLKQQVE
jgi:hypothetical protein